jgi:hypothetical protein
MCFVHGISNNIEDEESDLKSPFSAMKELQPEDDTFSDSGAAVAVDDQIIQDTLVLDNLSEAGDCGSDTFESGYVQKSPVCFCQLTDQNSGAVDKDPSTQVMLPSMQDSELVPLYKGLPELGYIWHFRSYLFLNYFGSTECIALSSNIHMLRQLGWVWLP